MARSEPPNWTRSRLSHPQPGKSGRTCREDARTRSEWKTIARRKERRQRNKQKLW